MKEMVSVVIPTYKRGSSIIRAVKSIRKEINNAEIIIINQNAQKLGINSIVEIKAMPGFPGKKRDLGVRRAKNNIIIVMDDDNELVDWSRLEEVFKKLKDPGCGIIQVALNGKHEWVKIRLGFHGGGIIFEKKKYIMVGGYGVDYLDDVELFLRFWAAGFQNWRTTILTSKHHIGEKGGLKDLLRIKRKTYAHLYLSELDRMYPHLIERTTKSWLGFRIKKGFGRVNK